jgi:hypothetical protein
MRVESQGLGKVIANFGLELSRKQSDLAAVFYGTLGDVLDG